MFFSVCYSVNSENVVVNKVLETFFFRHAYFYFADALWLRVLGWDSDSTLDFLFCKELCWVIPKRYFNLSSDVLYFSISSRWEINFHLA